MVQVFSCEFCKISKNNFFTEQPLDDDFWQQQSFKHLRRVFRTKQTQRNMQEYQFSLNRFFTYKDKIKDCSNNIEQHVYL